MPDRPVVALDISVLLRRRRHPLRHPYVIGDVAMGDRLDMVFTPTP